MPVTTTPKINLTVLGVVVITTAADFNAQRGHAALVATALAELAVFVEFLNLDSKDEAEAACTAFTALHRSRRTCPRSFHPTAREPADGPPHIPSDSLAGIAAVASPHRIAHGPAHDAADGAADYCFNGPANTATDGPAHSAAVPVTHATAVQVAHSPALAAPVPAALTETHTAAVGPSYTHAFGAAHYEAHTATVGPAHASASASALVGSVPTTHTEGLGQIELTGWLSCTSSMGTCLEWQ